MNSELRKKSIDLIIFALFYYKLLFHEIFCFFISFLTIDVGRYDMYVYVIIFY